jgi:glutathione S-transferase
MILYGERNPAPNPRRVRIFLSEKGIDLPETRVNMRERQHKSPEHKARNSLGQLPTLELDDGTMISESVSICRYLEATHPATPPLFGATPLEQATIDMWIRRMEFQLMTPIGMFWRHAHPLTASLLTQFNDFGESNRQSVNNVLGWLDRELADGRDYLAGDYSMADIVGQTTLDFADFIGLETPAELSNVLAWRARLAARPSASA